jgi:hypothetical protein
LSNQNKGFDELVQGRLNDNKGYDFESNNIWSTGITANRSLWYFFDRLAMVSQKEQCR